MKFISQYLLFILLFFFTSLTFAQGTTCADASPFCAGDTSLVFPNTSGAGNAEFGPDYGCLGSEPNPAWYFIQIDQSGDLDFNIIQNTQDDFTGTGLDVDFITYGPFNNTNVCDPSNLSAANTIACSYSPDFVENFTISNAMAGEIYVLLITNFSNQPGFIQLEQVNTGGTTAGSTDCSIVNTFNYCDGEVVALDATTNTAASYFWTQNGASLTETGPILNNVVAPDATYIAEALDAGGAVISTLEFIIDFHEVPTTNTIPDQVVCDDNDDGFWMFDFTNYDVIALGTQSSTDYSVTYHSDQVNADNDTNALTSPYTNQTAYVAEPIFVRIENNDNTSCYSTGIFNIQVAQDPTTTPVPNYEVCDTNNDGFALFDLTTQSVTAINGQANVTATYFESPTDANSNMNAIAVPATYTNTVQDFQTIHIRLDDTNTGCFSVMPLNLVVNALPVIIMIPDYEVCDDAADGDDTNGFTEFDLTSQDTFIINGQPDTTIAYFESQADADANTNVILNPTTYTNITVNTQVIYIRLENTMTNCVQTGSFNLVVNPLPEVQNATLVQCDEDGTPDGFTEYNLNEANENVMVSGDTTGFNYTHHLTLADAQTNMNAVNPFPFTNTTNPQTIYVRIENTTSGCTRTAEYVLDVTATDIGNAGLNACDDDYDGFTEFTLSDADATILATLPPGLTIAYYATANDAQLEINQLPDNYTNTTAFVQTVFIRVENANDCFGIANMDIVVDPLPQNNMVANFIACSDTPDEITIDLTQFDAEVLGTQNAADFTITYHETQIDADNGNNSLTSPYNNISNPQTLYVRVEDNTTACSISSINFDIIVNVNPTAVTPTDFEICDDAIIDGMASFDLSIKNDEISGNNTNYTVTYYETQADADNEVNVLAIPYTNNIPNMQQLFVRVEDNVTGCYSTTTLNLVVEQTPIAFTPNDLEFCDPDNDGFGVFTLTDADAEVTGGAPGLTVSYHETMADAENAVNPLTSPYTNLMINTQTIYVRVESTTIATDCATFVELQLIVNPTPQITDLTPMEVCDDNQDGINLFDFEAEITPQIFTGTQTAANFTLSYHTTQVDADSGNTPIVNTTNYTNQSNPQTIYIRLVSNANGCVTTSTFNIEVILPPVLDPTYDNELSQCDDLDANYMENNDGITSFDLTVENAEIVNGNSSWIVTYYETQADAQADTNAIPDPTAYTNSVMGSQTLYVRVSDNDTGCFSFTTVTLRVLPNPSPSPTPADLILCDDTNAGDLIETFDLTQNEAFIINGEAGVTASYYTSQTDAITANNAIADPAMHTNEDPDNAGIGITPQAIYVRVTNGDDPTGLNSTGCYSLVSFNVIVNPLPEMIPLDNDYIICELNTDGFYDFDLESMTPEILSGQDPAVFAVTYHETLAEAETAMNALNSPYTNTTNPQPIYVNITNTVTGCDMANFSFNIEVQEAAQANPDGIAIVYEVCDDNMVFGTNPANDTVQFDLATQNPLVLDGQDPTIYTVSYYANQGDADAATNPLPLNYTNTINPQVIIVRVDNDTMVDDGTGTGGMIDSSNCYDTAEVTLQVNPLPAFNLEDTYVLCLNTNGTEVISTPLLDTGLSAASYTFEWFYEGNTMPGETGASITPTEGGNYTVVVTDISTSINTMCASSDTTLVELSEPPVVNAEVISQAFAEQHDIAVTTTSITANTIALYEFSLDGGPWEVNVPNNNSYTFTDVGAGEHSITVRDLYGCGESTIIIMVMDYPQYFTPNGDGYNDTWNIYAIGTQPDAVIYIYDRYGKLLKQLSPTGEGWDGTYNNNPMPTSDYWFTVEYREPNTDEKKALRAHFTLKR
ncbi:T9SS type B sorting domain-containing protein [Lacinutrix sp. Hel_I_90]|uniref:T9SS type B sorting domain-containing protein n=1 Tax=Lacinutrix sp. Hel_I_90 TaxID=1249999 RepID=UPI0005CA4A7D|nr:T9SS type B sorting domain-containing protein [Lacinutrix sp. Hel_I_90]